MTKVNIIAQYHPAAALHNPRLWSTMLMDWQHLPQKVDANYTVVSEYDKLTPLVAFDTENDITGNLGAWSVAWRGTDGRLYVYPQHGSKPNFRFGDDQLVVAQNYKWDAKVLDGANMKRPIRVADTMIAAYCLGLGRQESGDYAKTGSSDNMIGGLGLKYLARRHLGMPMKTWTQIKDKPDEVPEYNANDSIATFLLFEKWQKDLPKHFWNIDMPLLDVCMSMEDRGMLVDPDFLQKYADTLDKELAGMEFPEIDGKVLNPFSPKQLQSYVYGTLGIEPTKWTDTKQPSTDADVLETIDDPIIKRILRYKEFYKERKTYVSTYAKRMDEEGRIHPEFKQTSTATGRLSCARPNLQNVTKGTDLRKLFIAPPQYTLIDADFDQLELRVFAAIANETNMLAALEKYDKTGEKKYKIHSITAEKLGVKYDDAKVINFLMLYGGGAWKISQEFHVPVDDAKTLIKNYYKSFPGIKRFHEEMIAQAYANHEVVNYFGRRRRLDAMFSEHWKTIKEGEREAVNTPVQGTAGDVVKLVMIALHAQACPMISQVHDELIIEYPIRKAEEYAQYLKEFCPTVTEINGVRFPVDVGIGKTWQEAKH